MKIRTKIIALLLIAWIIPAAIAIAVGTLRGQAVLQEQIGHSSLEFARLLMADISGYLYSKFEDVRGWSQSPLIESRFTADNAAEVSQFLTEEARSYGEYHYIVVLDLEGNVLGASDLELMRKVLPLTPAVVKARGGTSAIDDPAFDPLADAHALKIVAPIGRGSQPVGMVVAVLQWDAVNARITDQQIGGRQQTISDHIMLIDGNGLVISCFDQRSIFHRNLAAAGMKSGQEVLRDTEGWLVETSEHNLLSFATYTYMKPHRDLPELNWHMVLLQDAGRVFAPVRSLGRTAGLTMLVISAVFVGLSILVANSIARPIGEMTAVARAVADGDLTVRATVRSKDEIGLCAGAFNTMLDDLTRMQDRLRQVLQREDQVAERERRRIATDLHDRVCQDLAAIKIKLAVLPDTSSADRAKELKELEEVIDQAIMATRSMIFELLPPGLHDLGLFRALAGLVSAFSKQYDVAIDLRGGEPPTPLTDDLRGFLFRATRELLINVTKHARAATAAVSVETEGSYITVVVTDDGAGFETSRLDQSWDPMQGIGLFSIRERARALGGHLKVRSHPGEGAEVTLTVPMAGDSPEE